MKPLIPPFDPVNFDLPFTIPILNQDIISMFGILVAAGLLLGAKVAMKKAEDDGLDPDILNRFVTWVVVGIFVGGHVGHVLMYESELIEKEGLITLLKFNKGLSSFGGFFACVMLSIWYFRKEGKRINEENRSRHAAGQSLLAPMKPWAYADAALKGFVPGYCIGRLGCFSVKDHPGQITEMPLGVRGMCTWDWNEELGRPGGQPTCADEVLSPENQERLAHLKPDPETWEAMSLYDQFQLLNSETALHDLGFYEALWFLALTPIFYYLDRKPRFPGFFAALLVFTHMPMRVFLDTMRLEVGIDRWYFTTENFKGLTPAQMGSIAFMGLGVWIFMTRRHLEPVRITVQRLRAEEAAKGVLPAPDDDPPDSKASSG